MRSILNQRFLSKSQSVLIILLDLKGSLRMSTKTMISSHGVLDPLNSPFAYNRLGVNSKFD